MKKFILLLWCCIMSLAAQAQTTEDTASKNAFSDMLNSSLQEAIEQNKIPDEILTGLESCTPVEAEKKTEFMHIKQHNIYKIYKESDDICILETKASTQDITTRVICRLNEENRKNYVRAIRSLYKNNNWTIEELLENEDNQTAEEIMRNPEICTTQYETIDLTKELREALKTCSPFEKTVDAGFQSLTRRIAGQENSYCRYTVTTFMDFSKSPVKELFKDMEITNMTHTYICNFSENQINKLIKILEKQVLPAGNMDKQEEPFNTVKDASKEEIEFINSNCQFDSN